MFDIMALTVFGIYGILIILFVPFVVVGIRKEKKI